MGRSVPSNEDAAVLETLLGRQIISPRLVRREIQTSAESRIPAVPTFEDAVGWREYAERLRQEILDKVVLRGEGAAWRNAVAQVEWLDPIEGGPGYRIRKLRYEAVPGLWIPALLYEPESLSGRVPAVLNVNGHEKIGKAVPYKQIRCINLARRGMLALNVEWIGMGQLQVLGLLHRRQTQLDLCGTSGLAPFYLSLVRGLDLLLSLEHIDPERVAVAGLSGGGWQTIFISALDTRVALANPVAGYGSLLTGVQFDDLGDAEQSPCDLATVADYTHLTALMAPRPTLLTKNSRDTCCFQAHHALPPLLKAAQPVFRLYGKEANLRWHVNYDPGTHNFERENREAFYRMLGDYFYPGDPSFDPREIDVEDEVKSAEDLHVDLPADNADFQSLALALSEKLPRRPELPGGREAAEAWQQERRTEMAELVRAVPFRVEAIHAGEEVQDGVKATFWWFRMDDTWTVPGVELVQGAPSATTILVADEGRKAASAEVERLLGTGHRVVAVDPFFVGESASIAGEDRAPCFALLVSAVGGRPLGLQASQVAAVARWAGAEYGGAPATVVALGPRASLFSLLAAGLEEVAIGGLELHGSFGSLKEVLEQNGCGERTPEVFCFGLLEAFDILQLAALSAPRPVVFRWPSERARRELTGLRRFYSILGVEFQPLQKDRS